MRDSVGTAILRPPTVKILAVDDHESNLVALQAALEGLDLELVRVSSGLEALEKIEREDFAAILMDVQMPVMDGFETAKRVRQLPRAAATPIIFVTAIHQSEAYIQQAYTGGAVDYLFKPLNAGILRAKVQVFCDLYRKTREVERQGELLRLHSLQQQENRLLRELLQSRDEFISIASHELKTPLTPLSLNLQAFSQLLESNRILEVPQDRLLRMLNTANSQVDRMTKLVDDLLDVSRIMEGRLSLERDWLNLSTLVTDVTSGFEVEFKKNGVELSYNLEPDVMGRWDKRRLEQVVTNLLTNALKYGKGKPVKIEVESQGGDAVLKVTDRGIGISKDDQGRIFKRFERASSAKHFGGMGLGLYIASQIIELHQGRIEVESQPDQGATFIVSLPKDITIPNRD